MLEGHGEIYSNTDETDYYIDRAKPTYIGNYVEISSLREYQLFDKLSQALRSGDPQNEIMSGDEDWVDAMYRTPERLRFFLRGMTGHSLPSAMAIARQFPLAKYHTFIDIDTAEGCFPLLSLPKFHLNRNLSGCENRYRIDARNFDNLQSGRQNGHPLIRDLKSPI